MSYYIGVVHRAQVLMARDAGVVSFSHGKQALVRSLAVGDKVIYYAPRSDFRGDPVQAFVAHATVTGDEPRERQWREDFTAWVRDATYDEVTEVPVRPLLEHLSFVKNPKSWGMTFRGGRFSIPEADYKVIVRGLLGGAA